MQSMLTDRVSIDRATKVKSTAGIGGENFAAIATNVACSIQPRGGSFRQMAAGRDAALTHRVFFNPGQDIRAGDYVVHGGVRYLVTFVGEFFGNHLEVDLERLVSA